VQGLASILRGFLRLFVALVLLSTAIGKLLDVEGFAGVIATYQLLPAWVLLPLAWLIPLGELVLGAWIVLGARLRWAALGSVAMHAGYTAWTGLALVRGLVIANCGCFGVFWARPLTMDTVIEDGVMVLVSVGLAVLAPSEKGRPLFSSAPHATPRLA
jgi:hypothetical protein